MPTKHPNIENWDPTNYEKDLLKSTWSSDFDFLYNLGANIYIYIFNNCPDALQLFPNIRQYGDKFKESKEFRTQALKFVQSLAQCIKSLYNMDAMSKYLYSIGERHVKFAERGFRADHWDLFQDAIEYSLADHIANMEEFDEKQKEDAVVAWRKLALYVITHLKRGFNDLMAKENHHHLFDFFHKH